jgi:hypothetical protein
MSLTFTHNITTSNIGITPGTVLTAGFTFSTQGVSFNGVPFDLYASITPFEYALDAPNSAAFALGNLVAANQLAVISSSIITQQGDTFHHYFGLTLVDPQNNQSNSGFIANLNQKKALLQSINDPIKYGVFGTIGTTNYTASINTNQTVSGKYIGITSSSAAGIAGSTISVSCDSIFTSNYFMGLGTTLANGLTNIFSCVAILGCISGFTLNNTDLSSTQIQDILGDFFDTTTVGNRQNTIRNIDTTYADEFKTDASIFVIPRHIPSGRYHLIPIPRGVFNPGAAFSFAAADYVNTTNLNFTPITITNNLVGMTSIFSANVDLKFAVPGDRGFISSLFAYTDKVETPSLFVDNFAWGITSGFSTTPFNRLDYGSFSKGSTVYNSNSESGNFVPPLFGFIPLGLTAGSTLTVRLDGITFYEKIYNPYKDPHGNSNSIAYFNNGINVSRNQLFTNSIFNSTGSSTRKNIETLNKAFYRIDFNSISNPWGFTGFTYSGPATGTLNFIYGNPANGVSFNYNINTVGNGQFTVGSGSNNIDINGSSTAVTLTASDTYTVTYTNRPYGYLHKLNLYRGSDNSFVAGITLEDYRTSETSQQPNRNNQLAILNSFSNTQLSSMGPTGSARHYFERSNGTSYLFASTPVETVVGTFNPVHSRGNIIGLTYVTQNFYNVAPAVDLMRITVNHGLTNIENDVSGRNSIHSRYYLGGNVDNINLSGIFSTSYSVILLDSFGPESIGNNTFTVSNRTLTKNFRQAVTEYRNLIRTVTGLTIAVPLRNYNAVIDYNFPNQAIDGNPVSTLQMNYFDNDPYSIEQLSSFSDNYNYLHRIAGQTLIFDTPTPAEFPAGLTVILNERSFIRYQNGNTFFPASPFSIDNQDVDNLQILFYDYRITGLTLSSTSSVGLQDSLTATIIVNDLPPALIFDGLRLQVISGGAEIFGKNILYSTSSALDYRIPNYNTYGNTFSNYYTATPLTINQVFVGSGAVLGGITITPPSSGWPASDSLTVRVSPLFKSFINISDSDRNNPSNNYIREATFTTATAPGGGGGGGGSAGGSISVSESVVTGVAFTNVENDFYAGFLCGVTAYNIITNNSTSSFSIIRDSSNAYANARAALDAGSLLSNTTTDFEIHSLLNYMDYGGNAIISPTVDGLLGSNYEYDVVFCEDNKRYGELMRIGSEKNHAIVIVGTSLEEDAASFTAPAYTNLNSAGLVDGLTFMTSTSVNKGEYVFSVLGYKNRTRFYGSGTDTVRLYLSSDVAGSYARSYVENKYHLSSSGSARGSIKTYSSITPTIVDRDLAGYYSRGINPIYIPSGTNKAAIWGDATGITTGNDAYRKSASVAKNTSTIKREFKKIFEDFQFEQNNAGTRAQFVSRATTVLDKLQSIGGLSSYTLTCNETNNTPAVVAQKRLVVDLVIVPNNSIESIVLNFVLNQI